MEYGEGMVNVKAGRNRLECVARGGRRPVAAMVYGLCSEALNKRVTPMM